ncbi:hypothetical protein PENSPDRAFT_628544 [Peniophora sp. CONT]|nr:hypothetical protein PENSPDRAFT_628544 [Peniophora sp. CONT]
MMGRGRRSLDMWMRWRKRLGRERSETLKELKEKIVDDDVSHLLLLNRRNPNVESTIFAAELEKFKPYQQKLSASNISRQAAITEVTQLWRGLCDLAGRGEGARRWEEREHCKADAACRFQRAGEAEVNRAFAQASEYVRSATVTATTDPTGIRLEPVPYSPPPPYPPPPPIQHSPYTTPPSQPSYAQSQPSYAPSAPPPPPPKQRDPYASLGNMNFSSSTPPPPPSQPHGS